MNLSTSHKQPSEAETDDSLMREKHGYGHSGLNKHDKEAAGLFYLNTLHLPKELDKNLQKYLKSKSPWCL